MTDSFALLMLGVEASGKSIETIEGIAGDEGLHRCDGSSWKMPRTMRHLYSGFIVIKALLAKNPDPDEETIRYWLAGNLPV